MDLTTTDFDALKGRAESAVSINDWAAAAAAYEQLASSHPKDVNVKCELARAYQELGRLQEAIGVLRDPVIADRGKAKHRLAKMLIAAKDYSAAKPLLDELIKASPDVGKFQKWRALCEEETSSDAGV